MAKVVYTDHDKAAPYVSFHGVAFTHGQEVEVDDENVDLLVMARDNPFFELLEPEACSENEAASDEAASRSQGGARRRRTPSRPDADADTPE
jgi:hypothetical protein